MCRPQAEALRDGTYPCIYCHPQADFLTRSAVPHSMGSVNGHSASTTPLTVKELLEANLTDWRLLAHGLHTRFRTQDFAEGLDFVDACGDAAAAMGHHPEIDLRYYWVDLRLVSNDVGAVTQRDVVLAREISAIAHFKGLEAEPQEMTQLEFTLDTLQSATIGPFWAAVLTGSPENVTRNIVIDPVGRMPTLWMHRADPHNLPPQRFHIDVWVPPEVASQRIKAALAAGGRIVSEDHAPSHVVICDLEGNRACICTFLDR